MTCVCYVQPVRERLRLTQSELARRAGLSRQLVNMVERGKVLPSVSTALALAEALECEVSDLFQKPLVQKSLEVTLCPGVTYERGPVRLGLVGERWIGYPASVAESTGFGESDGHLVSREGKLGAVNPLRSESELALNLLILGSDPALGIVRDLWTHQNLEGGVRWQNLPTVAALQGLVRGEAHVAGVCFPDAAAERRALASLGMKVSVTRFASWEEGWMVLPGNPLGFRSAADLRGKQVRFLDQVEGSIGRMLADQLFSRARLERGAWMTMPVAGSPFECGEAIHKKLVDVAIGSRAVAEMFGLDFVPIQEVTFDLVIPRALLNAPSIIRLLALLQNKEFRDQLAGLPGYATEETGKRMVLSDLCLAA